MPPKALAPIAGRYRVLRNLSSSPESSVLLAEDVRRGRRCVLKLLRIRGAHAFDSARREFEVLRRLRHPGIARVFDFGRAMPGEVLEDAAVTDGEPDSGEKGTGPAVEPFAYLACEYYEGLNLSEAFLLLFPEAPKGGKRAEGDRASTAPKKIRWRMFLEALARICEALQAIHSKGLIHYDIKPENLLLLPRRIGGELSGFEVKILDFGLAEEETTPLGTRARGTVPFIAPECLERSIATQRSDLFSLGVAMAFAVARRSPFPGSTPERWVESARSGRTLSLRRLEQEVPEGLIELIEKLIQPDPDDRPSSAGEVRATLESIAGIQLDPIPPEGGRPVPRVGWERELEVVRGHMEKLIRGEADKSVLILEGGPDQFLGHLLDEIEVLARAEGARAASGASCLPRRFPYQPFSEISQKLSEEIDFDAPSFDRFACTRAAFTPGSTDLERLRRNALPPLKTRLEACRFLDLATQLFLEAAREKALVLCVRDLQLAGRESLDLLRSIARNVRLSHDRADDAGLDQEPAKVLIVGTLCEPRSDGDPDPSGAAGLDVLNDLLAEPYTERIRLEPLGLDRLPAWIDERAPDLRLGSDFVRRIHEKSTGSPWLVDEILQRLERRLHGESGGPVLPENHADSEVLLRLPRKAEDAAFERVEALRPPERQVLEALATAQGWLGHEELIEVLTALQGAAASESETLERVERLRDQGFIEIREAPSSSRLQIGHPGLASQIYRQMREDLRGALHRAIAHALLESSTGDGPGRTPEDVAFHARMGGLNGLYFKQTLIAAERLAAAQACEAATHAYEEALERLGAVPTVEPGATALPLDPDFLRRQIHERLASLYLARGHQHKAIEKLTLLSSTHELIPGSRDLCAVYRSMGEVYQQGGELANTAYFLEKSLKLSQARLEDPRHADAPSVAAAERLLGESLLTLLALGRYHLGRESLEESEKVLKDCLTKAAGDLAHKESRCRAHMLLAEIEMRRGNHARSLGENLEALKIAEEVASTPLLLETLSSVGWSYLGRGAYEKAVESFERALTVARHLESKLDVAVLQSSLGTLHHNRADHQRALECFAQSLLLNSQIGDLRGIANSYNNLGIVHRLKDELARASDCYKRAIDLFSRINDQSGMATGMNNLSSILELEGNYDEALDYSFRALDKRKKSRSRSGMAFSYYRVGKIYQAKGELDKALTYAEKSLQIRAELGEKLGTAYSRLLLAELALGQGKYPGALQLCEAGLNDFRELENEVGVLLARETLARVLLRLGDLEHAREILSGVLDRSRELEQPMLTGSCLLHLARVASEEGSRTDAEKLLAGAERLFRSRQNRRELAEVLLEVCALRLETGRSDEAADRLEEAYSSLEELGIRDLVPHYFLLRGRIASATAPEGDKQPGRKYLERGLVEARELNLPELEWRLHLHLGEHDSRVGDVKLARMHFQEARDMLNETHTSLPARYRETFFAIRERNEPARRAASPSAEERKEPPPSKKGDTDSWKVPTAPQPPERPAADEKQPLHTTTLKLHEVAALMGKEKDLKKLLEYVMDAVIHLVDAERGFVLLLDKPDQLEPGPNPQTRAITVARNLYGEEISEPEGKVSDSVAKEVLRTGNPVLEGNAFDQSQFVASKSIRDLRLRSLVCVPLCFRGEVLGAIYLDNRHRRNAFKKQDLEVLKAFAEQAAVAVKNASLIEENVKRSQELLAANREMESLNLKLRRTVHKRNAQLAIAREDLRDRQIQLEDRYRFQNIVGKSKAMRDIFSLLEKISTTHLPVLLEGESGTGKELIARAIHFNSPQKHARFVSQNCGALTETLLESELFGHTRGAFTGAISDKKGLFEIANEGTLFLDEVGDMSLGMQQKLLRVLQEREIRRVGGKETIEVDVRIISASNKDLLDLVGRGLFREDLYYRLNGLRIAVPSLRERREDIPLLVEHFLESTIKPGEAPRQFQPEAMKALMAHRWPGNVRELRHFIERTLLIAPEPLIREEDLIFDAPWLARRGPGMTAGGALESPTGRERPGTPPARGTLRDARSSFEREFLALCLQETEGNVAAAARRCRISRESFYRLLRKYRLDRS